MCRAQAGPKPPSAYRGRDAGESARYRRQGIWRVQYRRPQSARHGARTHAAAISQHTSPRSAVRTRGKVSGVHQTVVKAISSALSPRVKVGAVKAARAVKVSWTDPGDVFPPQLLFRTHASRDTKSLADRETRGCRSGPRQRRHARQATYAYPFRSHATMGPGCAVADVQMNGITIHLVRRAKAHASQRSCTPRCWALRRTKVRVAWMEDSGSYGRPGFDDVGGRDRAVAICRQSRSACSGCAVTLDRLGVRRDQPLFFELRAGVDANSTISGAQFTSKLLGRRDSLHPDVADNQFPRVAVDGDANTSGFDEFCRSAGLTRRERGALRDRRPPEHRTSSRRWRRLRRRSPAIHPRSNGPSTSFAVERSWMNSRRLPESIPCSSA